MSMVTRCDGCLEDIDERRIIPIRVLRPGGFGEDIETHFHRYGCLGMWVERQYEKEQATKEEANDVGYPGI